MASLITLNNGTKYPSVGLGLWKIPNEVAAEQVYNAIKLGYRAFDGASDYGNEKEVGQGFKRALDEGIVKREELYIISKLWNTYHDPANVKAALQRTLSDLSIDYIDLYYIHFPIAQKFVPFDVQYPAGFGLGEGKLDLEDIPLADTYKALEALVKEGLIKSLGISNFSAALILDLLKTVEIRPVALQIEHHPYLVQPKLVEWAQEQGLLVVAYSSFGPQSFLELGNEDAANTPVLFDHPSVTSIAAAHGKSPSQILLRWATQRGLAVIPKSSNKDRLLENLHVNDFDLTADEIKQISALDKNIRFNDPWNWRDSHIPIFY